ncbi:Cellobiose 2-epimerase [Planctomycetes bacterium CA13]|uniref:Cellobiose 2-epimerase n=1 Tax=Novipirellula herctigrandis TaxID=2527986 RepID=A0A5C5YMQ5_9BACT|nr:Cellobiose 2-epimerase [Planctomycetes bacterium CA13]
MFIRFTLLSLIASLSVTIARADNLAALRSKQCRDILQTSITHFYLPDCIDADFGGYLEVIDEHGTFISSEKFLTLQARQVWFFSKLANTYDTDREKTLAAAKSGYDFLRAHFFDPTNGGYFSKTDRDGTPTDRRKHVYPNAFVIYAFAEYHRATGDQEPLDRAMELFQTLEEHCHDKVNGGYHEFFSDDWQLITDPKESGYIGVPGTKTYNSHLHLLEAFTPLYLETHDPLVRSRLIEMLLINTCTVKLPDFPCNVDAWYSDWKLVDTDRNRRASYGHDVECVWLVLEAAEALGMKPNSLRSWAVALCDHAIERGFDTVNHGFFYTGPVGKPSDDRKKVWWTQSEALVAMLRMHALTGDEKYRTIFEQTFDFVQQHQIAPEGGWWATVNQDGSKIPGTARTSMWQGAYHNGRALLMCEQMLNGAASR